MLGKIVEALIIAASFGTAIYYKNKADNAKEFVLTQFSRAEAYVVGWPVETALKYNQAMLECYNDYLKSGAYMNPPEEPGEDVDE